MDPAFDQVAFATDPGQISKPFQTKYGWHIVKVYAKDPNRPMTDAQLSAVQSNALDAWVASNRATMKISSEAVATATPAVAQFAPPADAPPTPTATVETAASPVASPVTEASPVTGASPVAASPEAVVSPSAAPTSPASPAANPAASPMASPTGSPQPKATSPLPSPIA